MYDREGRVSRESIEGEYRGRVSRESIEGEYQGRGRFSRERDAAYQYAHVVLQSHLDWP